MKKEKDNFLSGCRHGVHQTGKSGEDQTGESHSWSSNEVIFDKIWILFSLHPFSHPGIQPGAEADLGVCLVKAKDGMFLVDQEVNIYSKTFPRTNAETSIHRSSLLKGSLNKELLTGNAPPLFLLLFHRSWRSGSWSMPTTNHSYTL